MRHHCPEHIREVFGDLHSADVEWILLRNTCDELPRQLPIGKDIDVLVRIKDRADLRKHLKACGYTRIRHPHRNDVRLYGVHEFEMYRSERGILLDVNFEIAVRSLDAGQWVPLDSIVQESAWRNRQVAELVGREVPTLGSEDMFVCTVARCVFDRREFSDWHGRFLKELLSVCDAKELNKRLRLVFFSYTNRLLTNIAAGRFAGIVEDHLSFSDY